LTSSAKIAGGDIQLSVDRAHASEQLQQLRAEVRTTFAGMSDDSLKFASAQDRLDRALTQSGGKITSSVRSAELNLRRVQQEAVKSSSAVSSGANRSSSALAREERQLGQTARGAIVASGALGRLRTAFALGSSSFLGGFGATFLLKQFVDEASNVQEETEKTGVVFGENAADVQRWAGSLAQSFGIGEGAALKAAGTFGNMLRPLGFGEQQAAAMSKRIVELSADMASFNNAKPDQVLQALASGLAGQVRPLRQYGVFLSQQRIQEEAVADGIAKHTDKLTQAQKVQAAYNIILKDTKNAQGDVARNTESLSVAESKLHAGVDDLEASLARNYLPSLVNVINHGATWLNDSKNQERVQHDVAEAADTVGEAVHGVVDVFRLVSPPIRLANKALGGTENTVKLLVIALAGLKLRGILADFGLLRTRTLQAGAAAVTAAGEYDTLAAAEGRAGAAGRGIAGPGTTGLPLGIPNVGVPAGSKIPNTDLRAPGSRLPGFGGLASLPLAFFGTSGDLIQVPQLFIDGKHIGGFIGKPPKPGSIMKVDGKEYVVTYQNGNVYLYSRAAIQKLTGVSNATATTEQNPRAGVPGSPTYTPPNAPATPTRKVPPLNRAQTVSLQVQRAQLAVARGDKGAAAQLVAALKSQIDLDRDNEKLQERLARTDVKNRKAHLAELQSIYSDEQSALDQIAALDQKNEDTKTKKTKDRAAAKKKAQKARDDLIAKLYAEDTASSGTQSTALSALAARSAGLNKLYADKIATAQAQDAKSAAKTAAAAKTSDPSQAIRDALSTLQEIIRNESNIARPDGLDPVHGTLKQMRTHLYQSENHLANIRAGLRPGPQLGPEFGNALRAGDAAFA
jgi:hypothetical protein